jgi:hypothetical protein
MSSKLAIDVAGKRFVWVVRAMHPHRAARIQSSYLILSEDDATDGPPAMADASGGDGVTRTAIAIVSRSNADGSQPRHGAHPPAHGVNGNGQAVHLQSQTQSSINIAATGSPNVVFEFTIVSTAPRPMPSILHLELLASHVITSRPEVAAMCAAHKQGIPTAPQKMRSS